MTSFPPTTTVPEGGDGGEKVEISAVRLAYYEALDAIVKQIIRPMSEHGHVEAEMEREGRFARTWPDAEVKEAMRGTAIWDDPPDGWGEAKLLLYSRGYLVGRAIVGGNLGQYYGRFVEVTRDPIRSWRRWRLGFLDMCKGAHCAAPCTGSYGLDEERIGLVCSGCGAFHSYEQVQWAFEGDREEKNDNKPKAIDG